MYLLFGGVSIGGRGLLELKTLLLNYVKLYVELFKLAKSVDRL